jgi:mannose-6-phosphate isomerase-like protein (cupin superfamily)
MHVRRVVAGRRPDGRSVIARDELVEPITIKLSEGAEFHSLWGNDKIPELPTEGGRPSTFGWFPPAEGYRFAFVTFPPEVPLPADLDLGAALAEVQEKLPGLAESLEPENPVMHRTDTVDLSVVLSGEIWLEVDDGEEILIKTGDTVVMNGARHAWHNRGSVPCVVAVAMIGART